MQQAERWRLAGWPGGVSPPPVVGRERVSNEQFGGGKRVAARDGRRSARPCPAHLFEQRVCIQKRQLRLPHSKRCLVLESVGAVAPREEF